MPTRKRRILFITGTRADFSKLRELMLGVQNSDVLDNDIVVTGMHLMHRHGYTANEVLRSGLQNVRLIPNQLEGEPMALTLANTVQVLARLVHENPPDAIVVHGDRVEALAGAIVGSLGNVRVVHIEGGERSGTIDDVLRHSTSKHAHVHLVSNDESRRRLIQLGEEESRIFVVGSPEVDVLNSESLPSLDNVRSRYDIRFSEYGIALVHPVTTEPERQRELGASVAKAVLESGRQWVVIAPNNDEGCDIIREELSILSGPRFVRLPSMRFEYFVTLMKNAAIMVGNSSAGVREAPVLGLPSVNVGTRQRMRSAAPSVQTVECDSNEILNALDDRWGSPHINVSTGFGVPGVNQRILDIFENGAIWKLGTQKIFVDRTLALDETVISA